VIGVTLLKPRRQRGFTLLDSLIVLAILGIIGMIIIPQFSGLLQETKLNEAASELISGIQYAENLAVRHRRPFGIQTDATGRWYKIYDNRYYTDITACTDAVPDDPLMDTACVVLNPLDKNWYFRDFDDMGHYQSVTFTTAQILFHPDGHCQSGDPAVYTDHQITVSLGSRQKTITIDGSSGRITVQ
jgi:type II secretion system protein H